MLNQLNIHNFAIANDLEIELEQGLSVLTGETGAGKSITLDALNLAIGARADSKVVKEGCDNAEIYALFDISKLPTAQAWMHNHALGNAANECILRRIISKDGRSRAYINGRPCSLNMVQELAQYLVTIHGQHAQQHLLERTQQRELLDRFAKARDETKHVRELSLAWHNIHKRIQQLQHDDKTIDSQKELLHYQLDELCALALTEYEVAALESEQKRLSQADKLLLDCRHALHSCDGDEQPNLQQILSSALHSLQLHSEDALLKDSYQLLQQAQIHIKEACYNLNGFCERFQADPQRLREVEDRLDALYQLARKHRVTPDQLYTLQHALQQQLTALTQRSEQLISLEIELQTVLANYHLAAVKLTTLRKAAAQKLQQAVTKQLTVLQMPHAHFSIDFEESPQDKPHAHGTETPVFLINTHPQQNAGSLKQIASGGELSRISLAIEVATQASTQVSTLVFDEIDAGIGGATAEVVGKLLRALGENKQVICVTHQAQLAAQAHQHFCISKEISTGKAAEQRITIHIDLLNTSQRVEEISRMIGGLSITQKTRDHAQELLRSA